MASAPRQQTSARSIGNYRWFICALLFLGTTVNYVDRQVIGLLKPLLETQFQWTESDYANIVFSFQLAYAIGLLVMGGILDRLGVRLGYSLAVLLWSVCGRLARFLCGASLGFAQLGSGLGLRRLRTFRLQSRLSVNGFPKKERALATGLFNSGTNIGALVTPLVVPWLAAKYGWQAAFYATGAIGALWVILWWPFYREPDKHPMVSKAELAHIQSDPADPPQKYPWSKMFGHRQTWAFAIGKFMTDPWWWFLLVLGANFPEHPVWRLLWTRRKWVRPWL